MSRTAENCGCAAAERLEPHGGGAQGSAVWRKCTALGTSGRFALPMASARCQETRYLCLSWASDSGNRPLSADETAQRSCPRCSLRVLVFRIKETSQVHQPRTHRSLPKDRCVRENTCHEQSPLLGHHLRCLPRTLVPETCPQCHNTCGMHSFNWQDEERVILREKTNL